MQVVAENRIDSADSQLADDFIVIRIICQLFSILDYGWHLDRSREPEVAIALLVSERLDLILGHLCRVNSNLIVNWQGCGCSGVIICNHVEVKDFITIVLDDYLVNNCSLSRVNHVVVSSLEESSGHSLVDKYIQQLRVVTWLEFTKSLSKLP